VSQLEHALQCAQLATEAGANDDLIVAALLHDIGHLLHDEGESAAERGIDAAHEQLGERWLSKHFPPGVTRPIAMHVDAKRYLCATDKSYLNGLSPASLKSLELQGGAMSGQEVMEFEADEFANAAVRLRLWDDLAKVRGASVPPLSHYRRLLESILTR
jgi:[1-hydroxy-2-(trimethylamino)ethyl]phosphonate dioxygenase